MANDDEIEFTTDNKTRKDFEAELGHPISDSEWLWFINNVNDLNTSGVGDTGDPSNIEMTTDSVEGFFGHATLKKKTDFGTIKKSDIKDVWENVHYNKDQKDLNDELKRIDENATTTEEADAAKARVVSQSSSDMKIQPWMFDVFGYGTQDVVVPGGPLTQYDVETYNKNTRLGNEVDNPEELQERLGSTDQTDFGVMAVISSRDPSRIPTVTTSVAIRDVNSLNGTRIISAREVEIYSSIDPNWDEKLIEWTTVSNMTGGNPGMDFNTYLFATQGQDYTQPTRETPPASGARGFKGLAQRVEQVQYNKGLAGKASAKLTQVMSTINNAGQYANNPSRGLTILSTQNKALADQVYANGGPVDQNQANQIGQILTSMGYAQGNPLDPQGFDYKALTTPASGGQTFGSLTSTSTATADVRPKEESREIVGNLFRSWFQMEPDEGMVDSLYGTLRSEAIALAQAQVSSSNPEGFGNYFQGQFSSGGHRGGVRVVERSNPDALAADMVRKTDTYKDLFGAKPDGAKEEEYLQQFQNAGQDLLGNVIVDNKSVHAGMRTGQTNSTSAAVAFSDQAKNNSTFLERMFQAASQANDLT